MTVTLSRTDVVRLWLHRQGLSRPRGETKLSRDSFVHFLEATGGLQVDTINVVDRAHLLTLWSRFGAFDRRLLDGWLYGDRVAYEYWGHEASILPISHLPLGRRRMRNFPPPRWETNSWWTRYNTSVASRRRVLRRIRKEGPLESADFEGSGNVFTPGGGVPAGGTIPLPKEDKRTLKLLWHAGRLGVSGRRHFRISYDLAERLYPEGGTARTAEFEDSWLQIGLSGNGVASERHLAGYWTAPELYAEGRSAVLERSLKRRSIIEVHVEGIKGRFFARPEDLDNLGQLDQPHGTTLLSPFDSLLWQRKRAEELLGFTYRVEIYVPEPKRKFGYYAMPILHDGRLVGRLDPKLHRDRGLLEIKSVNLEPGFDGGQRFDTGLRQAIEHLAEFVDAGDIRISSRRQPSERAR